MEPSKKEVFKVKKLLVFILFILLAAMIFSTDYVGLLSEKVAWNAGNEYILVQLNDNKPEYLSINHSENYRYGKFNIGNNPIDFILINDDEPLIWVDSNNNGSLMDDEIHAPLSKETTNNTLIFGWKISVKSFYETQGSGESRLIRIMARKEVIETDFEVRYCLYEHREGLVLFEENVLRKVKVFTTDPEGFYRLEDIYFGVDTDGDGQIALIPDSYELFYSPNEAFQIGNKTYKLKETTEDGRKVLFTETNEKPVEKPKFVKGEDFPLPDNFENLLEGVSKSDLLGKPFIVVLSKATPEQIEEGEYSDCCNCNMLTAFNEIRLNEIINISEKYKELKILWIVTSKDADNLKEYTNIYLSSNSKLVEYYGFPGEERVFIVDKDGKLVQFDKYWVNEESLTTDRPQNGKLMLGLKDIRTTVLNLVFN
jgi:hypothetical protein